MSDIERLLPHQIREQYLRAAHQDDGKPARITIDQVLRVQQIVSATLHTGVDTDQLQAVEKFLTAVVAESGALRGHTTFNVDEAWTALDRLPLEAAPTIDLTYPRPDSDEPQGPR